MSLIYRDLEALRARQHVIDSSPVWRVLIAEDEVLPAELLKRSLIRLGHTVVGTAQNGLEAIALTRALHPDVVIMDLRMPVMDGWTAMAELKKEVPTPIVVVSAMDDRESLEQAVDAGASGFLTKPVREDDLERALALAIARFADLQEIRKWRADAERRALEQAAQTEELERVIRELREAQLQLVSAARRAAVASLAHGLAHEINNALTPIIGSAQILALRHERDPETLAHTQQIIDHARRIANWTASFRQVTAGGARQAIPFSFNGIVHDVMALYAERFERLGIVFTSDIDESLPVIHGYADQIQEAWMSLVQNAVEAMQNGGSLFARTQYLSSKDQIMAVLSDSGVGIPATQLPHVFEPGFTTKSVEGQSLSLGWGLFMVKQVIKAHFGAIQIASPAEGSARGTTVKILLPVNTDWLMGPTAA
ncbi:MAG: hybrid sensor histidine kinase/response regulator [Chloroflexota bacterium]|nr:MAG: hybrid sensor histidine kinase/response regulator [Chloroflexota bacterium]